MSIKNPCAKFKRLRDAKKSARRRPPTYRQEELDGLFAHCDEFETAVFATLLLTGLRKRELYFLTWADLDLKSAVLRVSGEEKVGFSPKDYEEREIELPPDFGLDSMPASASGSLGVPESKRQPPQSPVTAPKNDRGPGGSCRCHAAQVSTYLCDQTLGRWCGHRYRSKADGPQRYRNYAAVSQSGRSA